MNRFNSIFGQILQLFSRREFFEIVRLVSKNLNNQGRSLSLAWGSTSYAAFSDGLLSAFVIM